MRNRGFFSVRSVWFVLAIVSVGYGRTVSNINGVVYSDYYYNIENAKASAKDENAFTFRRFYFTFENNISDDFKIRFRLDSEHGKFGSTDKVTPFVKHAYLEWSNLIPNHKLYFGISETNAFKNSESLWGYRAIENTVMDLNKISSSADMGIGIKGDLSKTVHHWLTVMNGTGYGSSEVDRFKKIGYALWVTPAKGLIVEGYADYEKQDPEKAALSSAKDLYGSSCYYTLKGFVGWDASYFSLGAEALIRTNKESGSLDLNDPNSRADVKRQGISVFGSWITPVPKLKLFGRYDVYDPNTDDKVIVNQSGTNGVDDEYSLIIAGVDYIPQARIHIMPNILIKNYTKESLKSDITARITLYYTYDSGKITVE